MIVIIKISEIVIDIVEREMMINKYDYLINNYNL